ILEAIRIMEHGLYRHLVAGEALVAAPAQLDAAEEIRLGPRHPETAARREMRRGAENLRIRVEARRRAAPVLHPANILHVLHDLAAREDDAVQLLVARHLDDHVVAQRIDHGNTDAMQAA